MLFRQLTRELTHLNVGLTYRNSGFQFGNCFESQIVFAMEPCGVGHQPTAQWRPNISRFYEFKTGRHYTDYPIVVASEIQGPPQNVWIRSERSPPEGITDKYGRAHRCVLLLLLRESSTQLWLNSENAEVVPRDFLSDQTLWTTHAREIECIESITPNFLKRFCTHLPVLKVRQRSANLHALFGDLTDHYESIGIREWQRLENDGVDETEDRSVSANSEGQRNYNNTRKARVLAQRAHRIFQILVSFAKHILLYFDLCAWLVLNRAQTIKIKAPLFRIRERSATKGSIFVAV